MKKSESFRKFLEKWGKSITTVHLILVSIIILIVAIFNAGQNLRDKLKTIDELKVTTSNLKGEIDSHTHRAEFLEGQRIIQDSLDNLRTTILRMDGNIESNKIFLGIADTERKEMKIDIRGIRTNIRQITSDVGYIRGRITGQNDMEIDSALHVLKSNDSINNSLVSVDKE